MREKYELKQNNLTIIQPDLDINIESGLKVKKKCLYYENNIILAEEHYHKDLLHGPSTFFSKNRKKLSISWFYKGKRYGKVYQYYNNGRLYSIQRFKADILQKEQIYYFEDGSVKTIMNYKDGCLHGEVKLFFENAKLKRYMLFENGHKLKDKILDEKQNLIDEKSFVL